MAYVTVPKDLDRVKNKVAFNLTMRQAVCLGIAAVIGAPFYFATRDILGVSNATTGMVILMLPVFFFALYEKDGLPLEKVLMNIVNVKFIRPAERKFERESSRDNKKKRRKDSENKVRSKTAGDEVDGAEAAAAKNGSPKRSASEELRKNPQEIVFREFEKENDSVEKMAVSEKSEPGEERTDIGEWDGEMIIEGQQSRDEKLVEEAAPTDENARPTDEAQSGEDAMPTDEAQSGEDAMPTDEVQSDEDASPTDEAQSDENARPTEETQSDEKFMPTDEAKVAEIVMEAAEMEAVTSNVHSPAQNEEAYLDSLLANLGGGGPRL